MTRHLSASWPEDPGECRWRAVCSCGWRHRLVFGWAKAAKTAADRHAKRANAVAREAALDLAEAA